MTEILLRMDNLTEEQMMLIEEYWIYLRKSRSDIEAEARGEGETLARHRNTLYRLAKEMNITITRVFPEVVSGESIFHRPEMTKMLELMKKHRPKGVLVIDIDRLGRGDKIDQGIIEKTFKECNTLIITPTEVFDMNQESGEFSVEVRSFFARFELKQTNKRLQRGRIASIEEGNYIATYPPYGYNILKLGKRNRTLEPRDDQAPAVTLSFDWYTHDDPKQRIGTNRIAHELNNLGYRTATGKEFDHNAVISILKNPVYAGLLVWGKKEQKKSRTPGKKRDTRTRPKEEWKFAKGKHPALTTLEKYWKAQEILESKYHVPYQLTNGITNPLAGLIMCDMCGSSMVLRPYKKQLPHLICYNQLCKCKSARFAYVEERLVKSLQDWLKEYKNEWNKRKPELEEVQIDYSTGLKSLEKELAALESQKNNLHDLLERGTYDEATYLERSKNLAERISQTKMAILQAEKAIEEESMRDTAKRKIIPTVEKVLDAYNKTDDPALKNHLLKTVLEKAVYRKEKYQKDDNFTLILYPKLPR